MSTMRDPAHSIVQDREIPADDGPGRDESPTLTRREFVTATAVAGAALGLESATFGVPNIVSGAAASTIKFGLLEDRSGNFAIFGLNKWHGTQLAIKEINDGFTLKGGLQGPGSPGVFAKVAAKPPIEHPKLGSGSSVIDRGEAPSKDAVVWDESEEYLEKSGDQGVLARKIDLIPPDPQSDNRQFK